MKDLAGFLASANGRILRGVAGIVLIAVGLLLIEPPGGYIVAVIGLIPLAAGVFDFCLLAPLFGMSLKGENIRRNRSRS